MATNPTPEQSGQRILGYFRDNQVRPGEMMLERNLYALWTKDITQRVDDLNQGADWLCAQGLCERRPGKSGALFLTDAGAKRAGIAAPDAEATGRRILAYYGSSGIRAGEMVMLKTLNAWWLQQGELHVDDLVKGLEWLGELDYLEQKPGKGQDALFLTAAGFAAI